MDLAMMETTESPLNVVPTRRVAEKNKTPLILIVDDDEDMIAAVASIGRKAGYSVLGASGGEECLSMLSRIAPHLIMLDVNMPELDGFETCRRARSAPNGMLVPIAFLTARQTIEDVKRGVAAGGDEFIVKPFDARYLVQRVALMISCTHALNAHRQRSSSRHGPPGAWLPTTRPRRRKIR